MKGFILSILVKYLLKIKELFSLDAYRNLLII